MASGWRGAATAAFGLTVLYRFVQPQASSRLGALLEYPARWARSFMDPHVPTFRPPKRGK